MPNPSGTNSPVAFDRFTRQIPYGEKKVQGDLQRSAPVAGESAASTPLNLPRAAGRAARATTRTDDAPRAAFAAAPAETLTQQTQIAPDPSAVWAEIASTPGAEHFPILSYYAQGR